MIRPFSELRFFGGERSNFGCGGVCSLTLIFLLGMNEQLF